jgi:hypothetical protein
MLRFSRSASQAAQLGCAAGFVASFGWHRPEKVSACSAHDKAVRPMARSSMPRELFHSLSATQLDGAIFDFGNLQGKIALITNIKSAEGRT